MTRSTGWRHVSVPWAASGSARRRRWARHRQDGRRAAPHGVPALLRPPSRPSAPRGGGSTPAGGRLLRARARRDGPRGRRAAPGRRGGDVRPAAAGRNPQRARPRGRGPGADRRGVADAAAALPDAQLHRRRGPRPGPARVHRDLAGPARAGRARPGRDLLPARQLPHAGRGHGGSGTRHPRRVPRRQRADVDPQHRGPGGVRRGARAPRRARHLAGIAPRGHRLRHRRPDVHADASGPCGDARAGEGPRVRPRRPRRALTGRPGHRGLRGRLRRHDPGGRSSSSC